MKLDTVTASEIGDYVFCAEAWRLRQVGTPSANRAEQEAGTGHHAAKATAERVAGGSIAAGRLLICLALLALAAWWLLR